MIRVYDIFKYAKDNNKTLFPIDPNYSWWEFYTAAMAPTFDRLFMKRYKNFVYWDQDEDSTAATVWADLYNDFQGCMPLWDLKFSRLAEIAGYANFDPVENYSMTEEETTMEGARTDGRTLTYGARHEETETNDDAYTDVHTGAVSPYDADTMANADKMTDEMDAKRNTGTFDANERQDGESYSKGSQENRRTLSRHGNIGVISGNKLLAEYIEQWSDFTDYVFRIFDEVCKTCLLVYASEYEGARNSGTGGATEEILKAIQELSAKVDTNTAAIRVDIAADRAATGGEITAAKNAINDKIDAATETTAGNISYGTAATAGNITTAKNAIIAEISGVESDEY